MFISTLFSWSLEDIFNENLFQVLEVPESFGSAGEYFKQFVVPLLEETRAELESAMEVISNATVAEVQGLQECKPYGTCLYDVAVRDWENCKGSNSGSELYRTMPGDIVVLADAKPETVSDLQRVGRSWSLALVTSISDDDDDVQESTSCTFFKIQASEDLVARREMRKSMTLIFLINVTTNRRIWNALHMSRNLNIINKVLSAKSLDKETCSLCYRQIDTNLKMDSDLNESQKEAVLACLRRVQCRHRSGLELIKGPPGTGKTKTVSTLLVGLLKMNCRTLTCTPTNVAVKEVASRVVKLLKSESTENASGGGSLLCPLGDILLLGNKDRLKLDPEVEEIYLDYRVQILTECFGSRTGWQPCINDMAHFLEHCVNLFSVHHEIESMLAERKDLGEEIETEGSSDMGSEKKKYESFLDFARDGVHSKVLPLLNCMMTMCTHIPETYMGTDIIEKIQCVNELLESFSNLLFCDSLISNEMEQLFTSPDSIHDSSHCYSAVTIEVCHRRTQCISELKGLRRTLETVKFPKATNKYAIREFCLKSASLIFCTAASSYKLYSVDMDPFEVLVIDEAAQLKECESTIPLQLPGIRHAILIGDECQLPAMVRSKACSEAGFGRSLFERLTSLEHPVHLLNIQYRMHPAISYFPNSIFYSGKIQDGENVESTSYDRRYLPGPMFGPYSFINVNAGREEMDDVGRSRKNMAEVAIVLKLVHNLHKAWNGSEQKLSIGVISPYAAQVIAIKKRLGKNYEGIEGFSVEVKSVDGFQGGEEDIIIISTVRSNKSGVIGFLSNAQRTNVALTRARHCLWILGCGRTLMNSESVWQSLVYDAKACNCFFEVGEDRSLGKVVLDVKKEYDQLEDLLSGDSQLFRNARWKVLFSDYFKASFGRLTTTRVKMAVISLLLKISGGWRPKKTNVDIKCERSSHIVKQFKVEGLYVICSVDMSKETKYIQVLKVWDILPLEDVRKLVNRLEGIFTTYTDEFIRNCNEKCYEGDLEVPKTWSTAFEIKRYKTLIGNEEKEGNSGAPEDECYVENSRVSDSLLLMKFYSLSSGVVKFLLTDNKGRELELPFEVTEEEEEVIMFPRSMFILGRSGTGKTTVLTMKLFKKEQMYHMTVQGLNEDNNDIESSSNDDGHVAGGAETVLKQLFVTVSGKLCYAVKHHVSQLKSFACGGNYSADQSSPSMNMINIDDMVQFKDIPDTFSEILPSSYPLVITFFKFLMMVDGTVGSSYFERFPGARQFLHGNMLSVGLQTLIKTREVNYERFSSTYWPHFNAKSTSKYDSSRVFTEIMSHIKGGICEERWSSDAVISRSDYVLLSESRASSLDVQQREVIYDIYEDYERMKMERGDFDVADLVIDLHRRLKTCAYKGQLMDYVYIDEVQDLTMRQIAIFKHVCRNVNEGFVFSGDTAQTIARGIDFRFEDIRCLFYTEFFDDDARKEKGHRISKIFQLSRNFRTHAGVLKLAQSVIDLLYHFFPSSIDKLNKETSRIFGEAPVLLEAGSDENAIMTIFGNKAGGHFVGFGAQQVILVRDDHVKREVYSYVGKQALVLTIVECKGLEFQDVLLYNFFGSSPLGNKWRVVYEYMTSQSLLDPSFPQSSTRFDLSKHNIMCSELKLLYVAITRTRQRLWICENIQDSSKPVFDYWKKKGLVQLRKLDEELAQAMQVASSPEEWKAQGYKLLREGNYEMATVCFERAGDEHGEKLAKAAGLRASADIMHSSNPEEASVARRQAANIFESIGKAEYAAECFYMLKDYEKAGKLYLQCGESARVKAGECFCNAGCYKLAAQVYFEGSHFSRCLIACAEGKLFEEGLQYIQQRKLLGGTMGTSTSSAKSRREVEKIEERKFLENAALHYHHLKEKVVMMRYVEEFDSVESMRSFLRSLSCLDELLSLEERSGNFLEAANIAKEKGDVVLEANLLEKAGHFKDASSLILLYVLAKSLWLAGSKGWPLKQFEEKRLLLEKAKSLANNEPEQYLNFVSLQGEILSNQESSLSVLERNLADSRRQKSISGQILSARKILDAHVKLNISKYAWEDKVVVVDEEKFSKDKLSRNSVSIETLVHCWTLWKDQITNMHEYLEEFDSKTTFDLAGYGEFCLGYFGVRRCFQNGKTIYVLLNPDAQWVREMDTRFVWKYGELTCIDVKQLFSLARRYWCSQLLSIGLSVLEKLEGLYSKSSSSSLFRKVKPLSYIYEIANFLLNSKFRFSDTDALDGYIKLSAADYFGCIFPLDWTESVLENMVKFRRSDLCRNMIRDLVLRDLSSKSWFSYGRLGRLALTILGSAREAFHGSGDDIMSNQSSSLNLPWKRLMEHLLGNVNAETPNDLECANLHGALVDTYSFDWKSASEYISPSCFLYLVERQLILVSSLKGYIISNKSSFLEWLFYQDGRNGNHSINSMLYSSVVGFIAQVAQQLLHQKKETVEWIKRCQPHGNDKDNYRAVVLRLVAIVLLLHLNCGSFHKLLIDMLSWRNVTEQLPRGFYNVLCKIKKCRTLNDAICVSAEAFQLIGNPVVLVNLGKNVSLKDLCPPAVFVDMTSNRSIDDVLVGLFDPRLDRERSDGRKQPPAPCAALSGLWNTFEEVLASGKSSSNNNFQIDPSTKEEIEKAITLLGDRIGLGLPNDEKCMKLLNEAISTVDELNQLLAILDTSENDGSTVAELIKKLQSRRPPIEQILNITRSQEDADRLLLGDITMSETIPTTVEDEENSSTCTAVDGANPDGGRIKASEADDKNASETKADSTNANASAAGKKGKGAKNKKGKRGNGGRKNKK
ncbi:unnamed protein product [Linum trigynum]